MSSATPDQRRRFEQLCLYRDLYARRGPRDSQGVIAPDEVIRYAEELLAGRPWPTATPGSALS
jgi:hypothetical protein